MILYRVYPATEGAEPDQPGGALYIPPQGAGRFDNPDLYAARYLSSAEAGAIAETFGRLSIWAPSMLRRPDGSAMTLARIDVNVPHGAFCDLDDPSTLISYNLRPSDVVADAYRHTQAFAARVYAEARYPGITRWSRYFSRWYNYAIWDNAVIGAFTTTKLEIDQPMIERAAQLIVRAIDR